jgi:hypothetical protein
VALLIRNRSNRDRDKDKGLDRDRGMDRDRDRDRDMDKHRDRDTDKDMDTGRDTGLERDMVMSPSSQLKNQPCTVQRLYVNYSTVTPLNGTRSHCTVGVRYGHDILSRSYGKTVFHIIPIRIDDTSSIVVKTLKPVLCSYRGGVPLSLKKGPWRSNR